MSLKVPGRVGACTDMSERQPNHILDPQRTPHEGGNGSPGLPPNIHERANPPPESRAYPTLPQKSALNRAVERTRYPYERNGWVFLPFGEAGQGNASIANGAEAPEAELKGKDPPKRRRHTGVAGGELHGYGEDESPRSSENKNPAITPPKRRWRRGAL